MCTRGAAILYTHNDGGGGMNGAPTKRAAGSWQIQQERCAASLAPQHAAAAQ